MQERQLTLHGVSAGDTIWLVEGRGILVALIVLAAGVWFDVPAVALVAGLFVALGVICRLWSQLALYGLRCELTFAEDRAFPDDEVELVLSIENRWPIPIAWLEIEILLPHRLFPLENNVMASPARESRAIHLLTTLLPFNRHERRFRLRCRTRGLYEITSVWTLVSDPLRLFPRRVALAANARLIVYPRVVPLDQLGLRSRLPQGDQPLRTILVDDPLRPIAVRDYRPGDPTRAIHWKASARRPHLQTKVLERTAQLQFAIYLDASSFDHPWLVYREALFERSVTAAASLATAAVERGGRVALGLSGEEPTYLAGAGGNDQLREILEALAIVTPRRGRPLDSVLAGSGWRQPAGATLVAIVPRLTAELREEIRAIRSRGSPVALLYAGLDRLEPPDGVDVFDIGQDRDLARALA